MPNQSSPESGRGFDAVAESRKWKEAVARETEGMTVAERIAYFRRSSSVDEIRRSATVPEESCVVREDPPERESGK